MPDSSPKKKEDILVGILYEPYSKFGPNLSLYEKILEHNEIRHIRMDISQPDFWEIVPTLDLFISRGKVRQDQKERLDAILPVIKSLSGIACYPDLTTYWPYDDKIKEYYLMKSAGFPMTESRIFWDRKKALSWIREAPLPLIFKLKGGASSTNVIMVKRSGQAARLIKRMFGRGISSSRIPSLNRVSFRNFNLYKWIRKMGGNILRRIRHEDVQKYWGKEKNYVIFQKFLPGNLFDTRVVTIGGRAFAFRRMTRKNDFRSSGSKVHDYNPDKIDLKFIQKALEISHHFGFQSMAYDFLYNENKEPEFCEISYVCPEETIAQLPGYWDKDMKWHPGSYHMQHLILIDALKRPDLKMPPVV